MNPSNKIIIKNGRELRFGYTTGSCATAASTAAATMLFTGVEINCVNIMLPIGEEVLFGIENIFMSHNQVRCSVYKFAGDDPDVTDGIEIFAKVGFADDGINIFGGEGVGVVKSKGLQCNVGEAAINPVPKKMIKENVKRVIDKYCYTKGIDIIIGAINGEEIAKKTFNPRIGIEGGISILGTTGIVEPMSEKALIDTIKVLIDKQKVINEDSILISPGNYGRDYCLRVLGIDIDKGIKISNFIGEAFDYIIYKEFKKVLLVGHIGKLVKIAGGIMNTHSSMADCRMEILGIHSAINGADTDTVKKIMDCKTTEEAISIIEKTGIEKGVWKSIMEKIKFHIAYRTKGKVLVEVILFSNRDRVIDMSDGVLELVKEIKD